MTYPTLFVLWTLQGLLAFFWLLLLPTDSAGFSAARWSLLGMSLALSGLSALAAQRTRTHTTPLELSPRLHNTLYLLALSAALGAPLTLLTLRALGESAPAYAAYAARLAPLALWFTLAGLEWLLFHALARRMTNAISAAALRVFLAILTLIALLTLLILTTRWGLTPSRDGSFGHPATPFLEWQIVLALLAGLAAAFLLPRQPSARLDTLVFAFVYLLTLLLWLADPLHPGFFATPPRAPNFEPYPFSDALIYAQYAQQALVGEGLLWPDIPTRPFYVSLLVWMHALAGQNYLHVITLQTLWLAFFPSLLYLLGRELGARPLGLMLALLAALRDLTANHAAPFALNYTYSKLYFSETPTALFLTLFAILALRWLKAPRPAWHALLTGGVLGIAALIRLQSVILLAPLALISLPVFWKNRRAEWLPGLAWMTLGVALALTPWLTRNSIAAGGLVLDNPISQSAVLAWRWGGVEQTAILPQQPGETTAQFTRRLTRLALEHFQRQPGVILNSAANHFFNNLISSLHIFPVRDRLTAPGELLWPAHAFWQRGARSLPLTAFYLLLFALGLTAAWLHLRWAGLLPLVLSLAYHAWTALFLSSGDRFLVPIDWALWLYQAWGLLLLAQAALRGLRNVSPTFLTGEPCPAAASRPAHRAAWSALALTAAGILLLGASIPLTEHVFPRRYANSAICPLATQPGELCLRGRAIYPRYYTAGDGEPGTAKRGYAISPEARLVFWLAGPQPMLVIFPLEQPPATFPHAADVWVAGQRQQDDTLRARIARIETQGQVFLVHNP